MEDYWLGGATGRIFLPLMKMQLPEIVDVHMPAEGVFHNMVIVSIRKAYPYHARKVMYALWGMGQMALAKVIVIVDEDVNVHDISEVSWKVLGSIDPRRDLVFVDGPVDALEHAAPRLHVGSKVGVDGTRKWASEGFEREWPPRDRDDGRDKRARHEALGGVRALAAEASMARSFRQFLRMVKFEHTIFGLPFVLMGGVMAAGGVPSAWVLFWMVMAAVGARNFAMVAQPLSRQGHRPQKPEDERSRRVSGAAPFQIHPRDAGGLPGAFYPLRLDAEPTRLRAFLRRGGLHRLL